MSKVHSTKLRLGHMSRALTLLLLCALTTQAQTVNSKNVGGTPEQRTARRFESLRKRPPQLLAFLLRMPKGGDLHNHLSGAIYAESYVQWAATDNLCFVTATLSIVAGTCDVASGRPPATSVLQNASLYGQAIDAMSMRNWDRSQNGHDHF